MSHAQVYALLRTGDLPGIKIGGRGVWRIERAELEAFITRCRVTPQKESPAGVTGETRGRGFRA